MPRRANYWEAIDDLNKAIELDRRRADALHVPRRRLPAGQRATLAMEDANRAVELNPRLPDAWLERGILNRHKNDIRAARRDFLQVLVLDADGPAGDAAARQYRAHGAQAR